MKHIKLINTGYDSYNGTPSDSDDENNPHKKDSV